MATEEGKEDPRYGLTAYRPTRRYLCLLLHVLPFLYLAGAGAWLYAKRTRIPDRIPIHYDSSGHVDGWAESSVWDLYGLLIVGGVLAVGMVLLSVAVTRFPKHPNLRERLVYERTQAKGRLVLLAGMHWITAYLCYLSVCRALAPDLVGYRLSVLIGSLMLFSAVSVGMYFALRPKGPAPMEIKHLETGPSEDPAARWKWGLFYWNPDDSGVIVEHRYGTGVTLNLARPASWGLLAALALVVVASIALVVAAG